MNKKDELLLSVHGLERKNERRGGGVLREVKMHQPHKLEKRYQ